MKKIDIELDKAWSRLVKIKVGACEYCGTSYNLEAHHIVTRSRMSTRWDPDNGICLCKNHHTDDKFSAHQSPSSFHDCIVKIKGVELIESIEKKSYSLGKYLPFEKVEILKNLNQQIKNYEY